mmetsp:Transcript_1886/g.4165  ORF Transcript_1886/g.4165 Transcript_1886/m.4165 type:complete len:346 (-) Transcript_1886:52-1089(-)
MQRKRQPTKNNRPAIAMFLCFAILKCFASIILASVVSAFVPIETRHLCSIAKSSNTMLFFETNRNGHLEKFSNSTGMVVSGLSSTGSKRSTTELSVSSTTSALSNICTSSDSLRNDNSKRQHQQQHQQQQQQRYKIYCDMDGCLVNFEKGVRRLLHTASSDLDKRRMWDGISKAPLWFEQLEWQMDGRRLWSAIKHLHPDILTGVPDIRSSRVEKFNWCKRELGLSPDRAHHVDMAAEGADDHASVNGNLPREDKTNIITCWSNNKYKECSKHGSILIDDRIDLKDNWESAGGIFIHHVNTETTIRKLRDLGVISEKGVDNGRENDWYWEGSWKLWTADDDDDAQ